MTDIVLIQAQPEHADALTQIAIAAKRHWNYPEAWIQFWIPQLTISAEYISSNEVWMMTDKEKPIAFYALSQNEDYWELVIFGSYLNILAKELVNSYTITHLKDVNFSISLFLKFMQT